MAGVGEALPGLAEALNTATAVTAAKEKEANALSTRRRSVIVLR